VDKGEILCVVNGKKLHSLAFSCTAADVSGLFVLGCWYTGDNTEQHYHGVVYETIMIIDLEDPSKMNKYFIKKWKLELIQDIEKEARIKALEAKGKENLKQKEKEVENKLQKKGIAQELDLMWRKDNLTSEEKRVNAHPKAQKETDNLAKLVDLQKNIKNKNSNIGGRGKKRDRNNNNNNHNNNNIKNKNNKNNSRNIPKTPLHKINEIDLNSLNGGYNNLVGKSVSFYRNKSKQEWRLNAMNGSIIDNNIRARVVLHREHAGDIRHISGDWLTGKIISAQTLRSGGVVAVKITKINSVKGAPPRKI